MVVQFEEEKVLGRPYCILNESFQYLKGTYKEDGENLFSRSCCNRTRGMVLKEGRFSLAIRKTFFCNESGKTLVQAVQRCGRYLIPGNIQGHVGLGSEEPHLVNNVPAHCGGVGLDDH